MKAVGWSKQKVAVTNADPWTLVSPLEDASYFAMVCATSDLLLRTDLDDANTEDILTAHSQQLVAVSAIYQAATIPRPIARFPAGKPVCWLKSVAPSATVMITWVI